MKTLEWKHFFIDVCTDETILEAVNDLGFDQITKFFWILQEIFPVFNIDFDVLANLIVEQMNLPKVFKEEVIKIINCMLDNDVLRTLVKCKPSKKCLINIIKSAPWKKCLIEWADRICSKDVANISEKQKQQLFNTDVNCTISILIYEFVTGKGKSQRNFYMSHAITRALKDGHAVKLALDKFYRKNKGRKIENLKADNFTYQFSPTVNLSSLLNIPVFVTKNLIPIVAHKEAIKEVGEKGTWSAFFVGGVFLTVVPVGNMLHITMSNSTGKKSLMLHIPPDVVRDPNKLTPFGTIKQNYYIEVPIDKSRLE